VLGPDSDPLQWAGTHLKPRPRIVEASGLVPRQEFVASPAYADFYRRHEIEHVTCLWLTDRPYSSPDFAGLMIARARAHGALSVEDRRRLEQVMPLLVAASMPRSPEGERLPELTFGPTEDLFGVPDEMATALGRAGIDPARLVREVAARLRSSDVATARRMFLPHPQHRKVLEVLVRWDPNTRRGALSLAPAGSTAERELRARSLTSAEICVLQAVSDGLGTDAIASDLFLSRETVRTHVKRILQKLDVPTRTQAALIMQRLLMAA